MSQHGFLRTEQGHRRGPVKQPFEELDKFLTDPQGYTPGLKMTFGRNQNPGHGANLIAYLRTPSDNPVSLPKAAPASPGSAQNPSQNGIVGNPPPNDKSGG
jgi:cytochrome c